MNDTSIASKAKAQLAHFMGKVFTRFLKPAKKGGPGSVPAMADTEVGPPDNRRPPCAPPEVLVLIKIFLDQHQSSRGPGDPAPAGLRRALRHRRRIAASDAKRRKPHPETHFSLYPCGCGAFPHSKNGEPPVAFGKLGPPKSCFSH